MDVFDRGDVVSVPLDPTIAQEQKGTRPALVLTTKDFNKLGDVLIAPITQGGDFSRYAGFAVSLTGTGCKTQGVALINKVRMLDLAARKARRVEQVPQAVIDEALGALDGAAGLLKTMASSCCCCFSADRMIKMPHLGTPAPLSQFNSASVTCVITRKYANTCAHMTIMPAVVAAR